MTLQNQEIKESKTKTQVYFFFEAFIVERNIKAGITNALHHFRFSRSHDSITRFS